MIDLEVGRLLDEVGTVGVLLVGVGSTMRKGDDEVPTKLCELRVAETAVVLTLTDCCATLEVEETFGWVDEDTKLLLGIGEFED